MNIGLEVLNTPLNNHDDDLSICSEYIDRMFEYYTNILTIRSTIEKYGYAQEGIIETIGIALKSLMKWLREIFRRFISSIGMLLKSISFSVKMFSQLFKLNKEIAINFNPLILETLISEYKDLASLTLRLSSDFKASIARSLDIFDNGMSLLHTKKRYAETLSHSELIDLLSEISLTNAVSRASIQNIMDVLCDTNNEIYAFEKGVDRTLSETDQLNRILEINELLIKKVKSLGFTNDMIHDQFDSSSIKSVMASIKNKIDILNVYINALTHCGKQLGPVVAGLLCACGKESCTVCVTAPIPDFLLKHLREHYQYPSFKLSTVFFTNDIIATGKTLGVPGIPSPVDVSDIIGGMTFDDTTLENKQEQSITCVHITHGMVKGILSPLSTGSFKQSTAFLTILVHEARHAYQLQTNKKFDGYDTKGYSGSAEEKDANKSMYRFEPTEQEQRWAKGIIAQYDAEVKKATENAKKLYRK